MTWRMKLIVKITLWATIITLSIIVCGVIVSLFLDKEYPSQKFSFEFEKLKPHYSNEFEMRLNKNFKQIDVYCKTEFIDTLKLDSLFYKVNSFDKDCKIWMNVYRQDSMIVYTHYYVGSFIDSIFGKAMGGYQY